jgi:S1-C subfamily serine protease
MRLRFLRRQRLRLWRFGLSGGCGGGHNWGASLLHLAALSALLQMGLPPRAEAGFLGDMQAEIQAILERNSGAVVQVISYRRTRANSAIESARVVSGVVWDDHHVVTYDPALSRATRIQVVTATGMVSSARFLGEDPLSRVAVLQTEAALPPPLPRRQAGARAAEVVLALANPRGSRPSVALGLIGGELPAALRPGGVDWMRIMVPIGPGDAGGALVDVQGRLIGLVAGTLPGGEPGFGKAAIAVAIPLTRARRGLERIVAEGGRVEYGYLGVTALDCEDRPPCVRVAEVVADSPADRAGLRANDEILRVNGVPVLSVDGLADQIVYSPVGARLQMRVRRGDAVHDLKIVLQERTRVSLQRAITGAAAAGSTAPAAASGGASPAAATSTTAEQLPEDSALALDMATLQARLMALERELDEMRIALEWCGAEWER